MEKESLKHVCESLIFASDSAITLTSLCSILEGFERREISEAINELIEEYKERSGGIFIEEVAGGYQYRTNPEFSAWIKRLFKVGTQRISRAAMESLSIIAYKQPVTRGELEAIRGVDSGGVLSTLMDKRLIKITGRIDAPGRPVVYGTTKEFLEAFDLKDLSCLPALKDIQTLEDEDAAQEEPEDTGAETAEEVPDGAISTKDEAKAEGEGGPRGEGWEEGDPERTGPDSSRNATEGSAEVAAEDRVEAEAEDAAGEEHVDERGEAPESDSERGGNVPA